MSKKPTVLFTLAMLAFGGYVGFVTNYTNTATAHEYVIPKFTDVPRAKDFNIDINLNNNAVKLNGQSNPEQNINVKIHRQYSQSVLLPDWRTKMQEDSRIRIKFQSLP